MPKVTWWDNATAAKKMGSTWKWPQKEDEHDYPIIDLKGKIKTPKTEVSNFRSSCIVRIPELEHIWSYIHGTMAFDE